MVDDRTKTMNRLTSCLKGYYPQALTVFGRLDAQITIAFLRAFPDPESLKALSKKRFFAFLKKNHYTQPGRADELYQSANAPAPLADAVVARSSRMRTLALLDQLVALQAHIKSYERQIQKLFEDLPESHNISNLPGVGPRIGPELLASLGPKPKDGPSRFTCSEGLKRLAGAAPVTRQSGQHKHVRFRRACDHRLRRTLYDWAKTAARECRWARAYYEYCRAHGHRYNTILRNLACKLLAILFRLWRTGEQYDEERHIQNLKKHNAAWAAQL